MWNQMELRFEKEASDVRGTVLFLSYGDKKLNIVEIKQGFSRGGHYHPFDTVHHVILGKLECREKNIRSDEEKTYVVSAPAVIFMPAMTAHVLTAIEDTLFAEEFGQHYAATVYHEYRKIVTQKMS
jgi:quercetin dioxygenase-like cupin family protein